MTAPNTPQPGPTVVPSAGAERRRIWEDDTVGVAIYVTAALALALLAIGMVLIAR